MTTSENPKKKAKRESQPLVGVLDGESKFIKALGSNDYQTREKGLEALSRFLTLKQDLPEQDMLRLWKGIFFCFWHSDLDQVQRPLAARLAKLVADLPPGPALAYYRGFYLTMRREWFLIDRLRLDKFMMLVRKFVEQTFVRLSDAGWDAGLVAKYSRFLSDKILLSKDEVTPCLGLCYQVCDVFSEELLNHLRSSASSLPGRAIEPLLGPFVEVMRTGVDKVYTQRLREGVLAPLIEECLNPSETRPLKNLNLETLHKALFSIAAAESTPQKGREVLYSVCTDLERAANKARRLGLLQGERDTAVEGVPVYATVAEAAAPTPASSGKGDAAPGSAGPGSEGKKKKKRAREQEAQEEEAAAAAAAAQAEAERQPEPETVAQPASAVKAAATPASGKKEKREKERADRAQAATITEERSKPSDDEAPSSAPAPVPASTGKKRAREAAAAEAALAAAMAATAAARPRSAARAAAAAGEAPSTAPVARGRPASASTPLSAVPGGAAGYDSDGPVAKKKVRFALKNNLVFDSRKGPPDPSVRTPPNAAPRGSALKKSADGFRSPITGTQTRGTMAARGNGTPQGNGNGAGMSLNLAGVGAKGTTTPSPMGHSAPGAKGPQPQRPSRSPLGINSVALPPGAGVGSLPGTSGSAGAGSGKKGGKSPAPAPASAQKGAQKAATPASVPAAAKGGAEAAATNGTGIPHSAPAKGKAGKSGEKRARAADFFSADWSNGDVAGDIVGY